jgi:accessory gene regulator protein AgrB
MKLAKKRFETQRRAAIVIQTRWRGKKAREQLAKLKSIVKIQVLRIYKIGTQWSFSLYSDDLIRTIVWALQLAQLRQYKRYLKGSVRENYWKN